MRYRFVGTHLEDLDEGPSLAPGDFIELTDAQAKMDRASSLIDDGLLIEVDEGKGPTEAAAKLAKAEKVDLSQVKGTGEGGRVTEPDVKAYIDEQKKGD